MSCESHADNKSVYGVGIDKKEQQDEALLCEKDNPQLIDCLLHQEQVAEHNATVSYESVTSD